MKIAEVLTELKTTPRPYQVEDLRKLCYDFHGRAIVGWEVGLGKTLAALMSMVKYPNYLPAAVVSPASLKWNWHAEVRKHTRLRAYVLEGRDPDKAAAGRIGMPDPDIYIINYEILKHWVWWLKDKGVRFLVCDEAHRIAHPTTQVSRAAKLLAYEDDGPKKVLALTGTPIPNHVIDLWGVLNVVTPDLFPSRHRFGRQFCRVKETRWGPKYYGIRNAAELNAILTETCLLRRRKQDVLGELPPKTRVVVPLRLGDREAREYHRAAADFVTWLIRNKPGKIHKARKALAVVKVAYLRQLAAELKLALVYDWVDNYLAETDEKLLLFAVHRKILKALHDRYAEPAGAVRVDGSVTGRKRQELFDRFNRDDGCRLLVGQNKAAGQGWNATACSVTATAELSWSPGTHAQIEGRTHGIGRGKGGRVSQNFYLVAKDTIEWDLAELLTGKAKAIDAAIDGRDTEDQIDLLEQLMEMTKQRADSYVKGRRK